MQDAVSYPEVHVLAAPLYLAFIAIELLLVSTLVFKKKMAKGRYEKKDAFASLAMGTGNALSGILIASTIGTGIYWVLFQFYTASPFKLGTSLWVIALAFILNDFAYYWVHRLSHEVRWFWANHIIHHSSQHYNLSTALRQPWFSFLTFLFVLKIPLALLGIHPAIIAFSMSVNLFYQFFIHTETIGKMSRPIEWLFNTPSHHRVHHGRNPRYLDSNYAGIFIIWDRLFGTFAPEEDTDPVDYGVIQNINTFNPLKIATHEYVCVFQDITQKNIRWQDRLRYLYAPPGWSHDNSRKTSHDLKRQWRETCNDAQESMNEQSHDLLKVSHPAK